MTVTNITTGELFTVRIYKAFGSLVWANNYELRAATDAPFAQTAIADAVNRLVALEQTLHLPLIRIDRAVVSTYQPDSTPYNPDTFTTIPVNVFGNNSVGQGEPVSLEHCIFVRRATASGRPGKLLYRGCLTEGGITTVDLRATLVPSFLSTVQQWLSDWYAQWLQQNQWELVMASGSQAQSVRIVQGLVVNQRIVLKQVGNAYFDRR